MESGASSLCVHMPATRATYAVSDAELFTVAIDSSAYSSSKSCGQGKSLTFSNIPVGHYAVTAYGKKSNGTIVAKGSASVDIEAGTTKDVTIALSRLSYWTVKFHSYTAESPSSYVEISSVEVTDGLTVAKPSNPLWAGHSFSYWTDTSGGTTNFNFGSPIHADTSLYAVFDAATHSITYHNVNTSSNPPYSYQLTLISAPATYAESSLPYTLPTPVQRNADYEFAGWYDNAAFEGSPVSVISTGTTGDKDYYAKVCYCGPLFIGTYDEFVAMNFKAGMSHSVKITACSSLTALASALAAKGVDISLNIHDLSITSIPANAFDAAADCLTGIGELPLTVTEVGNKAFYLCTKLSGQVIIPAGCTSVGYRAFPKNSGNVSVFAQGTWCLYGNGMVWSNSGESWSGSLTIDVIDTARDLTGVSETNICFKKP